MNSRTKADAEVEPTSQEKLAMLEEDQGGVPHHFQGFRGSLCRDGFCQGGEYGGEHHVRQVLGDPFLVKLSLFQGPLVEGPAVRW